MNPRSRRLGRTQNRRSRRSSVSVTCAVHCGVRDGAARLRLSGQEKAGELRRQVADIAQASGLDVKIRRTPYPGVIESSTGSLDTLSADRTAGHASGYDLVIVDETGLFPIRARDLPGRFEVVSLGA